ncbi:HNH endonuclease [Paramecium bursaria Chlorella virus NY2A]|uniref:Uncharacterized protein B173L n=2 Tax=Chlorovirus TaxID=181083 RepID=A7IW48_PBCVN|nr:HNH endonuclease [Paramecium bursaria Chlorella virus NY2A]ABT14572.1 hypothetical protein NY2A_B173L [Paramecium bursaria Chlorella virus NY2A]
MYKNMYLVFLVMIIYARAKYHTLEGETWTFKKRYVANSKGYIYNLRGKQIKYKEIQNTTSLLDDDNIYRSVRLNRLILSSFIEEKPPIGYHADHKDEEKWNDNSLENLQWLSPRDNTIKKRTSIRERHSCIPVISITDDDVRNHYASFLKASKITGIHDTSIARTCLKNIQNIKHKAGGVFWVYDMNKIEQKDIDGEIWKTIIKRDGTSYEKDVNIEVSNIGRIRWIKPIIRIFDAFSLNTERDHEKNIYPEITIYKETRKLHEIVCTTFNGPIPFEGAVVRHLNDDNMDCRVSNLTWGTRNQNAADAKMNGKTTGIKIKIDDIFFDTITEAAKYLKISVGYLSEMVKQKNKTSFSKYDFLQRIYIFQEKQFSKRKDISTMFNISISKVRNLEKKGVITIEYIPITEYNKLNVS